MFMKRKIILSIMRRRKKTLIICFSVFILGIAIAFCFFISSEISIFQERLIAILSPEVTIGYKSNSESFLDKNTITQLANENEVDYYNYNMNLLVISDLYNKFTYDKTFVGDRNFTLTGIQNPEGILVGNGNEELIEGRKFNQDEVTSGEKLCLIEANFAAENNINIGDEIIFYHEIILNNFTTERQLIETIDINIRVVGIFSRMNTVDVFDTEGMNKIYVSNNLVDEIIVYKNSVLSQYQDTNYEYPYTPTFTLNNAEDLPLFLEKLMTFGIIENYNVTTNEEYIQNLVAPINYIRNQFLFILNLSLGIFVIVLSILFMLFTRERKKEFGILIAMGRAKILIILDILLENEIIIFVGLMMATIIGRILFNYYNQNILIYDYEEMLRTSYQNIENQINANAIDMNYYTFFVVILRLYLIVGGVGVFASIIPCIYISRINPKKLLL